MRQKHGGNRKTNAGVHSSPLWMVKTLGVEVGVCGIYCGYCPVYRREKKRCFGCDWVGEQLREARESHKGCIFWECAKEKDLKSCFLCKDFPCELHYGKEAVYTQESLNMWKELMEKGFDFGK